MDAVTRARFEQEERGWLARAREADQEERMLVPQGGFEPSTYALRMRCSTG
jgi:hypothetical protein